MDNEMGKNASDDFLNLLMHNQMRIYGFVLSMVRNYEDADDILQNTVNTMWQKFEDSKPIHDFVAWGIQIAYYKILDYRKKEKSNSHVHYNSQLFEKMIPLVKEMDKHSEERLEKLKKCLKKLSPRENKMVELRYYQNMKPKQISSIMSLSILNVYKIMSRIHGRLLQCVRNS